MGRLGRWAVLVGLYAAYPAVAFASVDDEVGCQGGHCSETLKVGLGNITFELTADIIVAILAAFIAMIFIARRQNGQNPEAKHEVKEEGLSAAKGGDLAPAPYRKRERASPFAKG